MRFITIDQAKSGMMLAKSIYDYETRTLLREGKLLSDDIIARIAQRGYPGIYIEDELSKDIEIQDVISTELRNHAVETLVQTRQLMLRRKSWNSYWKPRPFHWI